MSDQRPPTLMLGGPAHGSLWKGKGDFVRWPVLPKMTAIEAPDLATSVTMNVVEYRAVRVYSAVNEPPVVVPVLVRYEDEPRAADLMFDYLLRDWADRDGGRR